MEHKRVTKQIKEAITDMVCYYIDNANYGMMSNYRLNRRNSDILEENGIAITRKLCATDEVRQDGKVIATITHRYASRKVNGMYKMLKPQITYLTA